MKRLSILSILFLSASLLMGQVSMVNSVIASAGSYAESGSYSISWTLGEVAVTTLENSSYKLSQGFHQAWDFGVSVPDGPEINWSVKAYPNPVQDQLQVKFSMENPQEFILELTDITGRKILSEEPGLLENRQIVSLDLGDLRGGIYFLSIRSYDNKVNRVYKIEKQH